MLLLRRRPELPLLQNPATALHRICLPNLWICKRGEGRVREVKRGRVREMKRERRRGMCTCPAAGSAGSSLPLRPCPCPCSLRVWVRAPGPVCPAPCPPDATTALQHRATLCYCGPEPHCTAGSTAPRETCVREREVTRESTGEGAAPEEMKETIAPNPKFSMYMQICLMGHWPPGLLILDGPHKTSASKNGLYFRRRAARLRKSILGPPL